MALQHSSMVHSPHSPGWGGGERGRGGRKKRKRRKKLGRSVEDEEEQSAESTMDESQKPQIVSPILTIHPRLQGQSFQSPALIRPCPCSKLLGRARWAMARSPNSQPGIGCLEVCLVYFLASYPSGLSLCFLSLESGLCSSVPLLRCLIVYILPVPQCLAFAIWNNNPQKEQELWGR